MSDNLGQYSVNHEGHWCAWCGVHSLEDICRICGKEKGNSMEKYEASNGWTITPKSVYYALDGPADQVSRELQEIKVAAKEAVEAGHDWAQALINEAEEEQNVHS